MRDASKATIIHGDAADHDLLIEEGIREADALIALTGIIMKRTSLWLCLLKHREFIR